MNYKIASIAAVLIAIAGFAVGSKLGSKTVTETKIVEVEKQVVKRDVVTQIKVVTRPDGTKEEVTLITDKTTETKDVAKTLDTKTKPDWHVSGAASVNVSDLTKQIYSATIERRVLGNVFIGATLNTSKQVGLVVGMEF